MVTLTDYTDAEWRELSRQYPDSYGGYWPGDDDLLRVGIGQSRDSSPLEESNYRSALKLLREKATENGLDPDEAVQEHRASHWAVGWVESLWIADVDSMREAVRDLHAALSHYPVVNEDDYSDLEQEGREEVYRMVQSDAFGWAASRAGVFEVAETFESEDASDLTMAAVQWFERDWSPSPDDYPTDDLTSRIHSMLRGGRTDV